VSLYIRTVVIGVFSWACYGQNVASINVFNSEIHGHASGAQSVELLEAGTQNITGRSMVDGDGSFVLRDVNPGSYVVRIIPNASSRGIQGQEVNVSVAGSTKSSGSEPIAGTVSAGSLANPPSKKALKYLNKAQRLSESGDSAKAIEVLLSAPLDPAGAPYIHSRLGTEYLKTRQYALAVPELAEAARLLPKEPAHHSNLAYVYQMLGQNELAEKEARIGVELDHANAKAHFLLGLILLDRASGRKEAIENLKLARREVPSARFLLGQAYMLSGQSEAAQREIDDFLSVATDAQRAGAQQWVATHSGRTKQVAEVVK